MKSRNVILIIFNYFVCCFLYGLLCSVGFANQQLAINTILKSTQPFDPTTINRTEIFSKATDLEQSIIDAKHFGFKENNPEFDNAIIFNKFLRSSYKILQFGSGVYYFLTKPDPIFRTVKIQGVGPGEEVSELRRAYLPQSKFEPFLYFRDGRGSSIRDLSIMAEHGNSNGCALVLENHNDENVGYFNADNLYISGYAKDSNWAISVWLHGAAKTIGPKGLRSINLTGLRLFGATYSVLEVNTVHSAYIQFSSYPAGGTTNLTRITSWPNDKSNDITIHSSSKMDLDVSNAEDVVIIAPAYMSYKNKNIRNIKML